MSMDAMEQLTKAEIRILASLAEDLFYKEIADRNNISINTVKKHLKNIYRRFGVTSRKEAIEAYKNSIPSVKTAG